MDAARKISKIAFILTAALLFAANAFGAPTVTPGSGSTASSPVGIGGGGQSFTVTGTGGTATIVGGANCGGTPTWFSLTTCGVSEGGSGGTFFASVISCATSCTGSFTVTDGTGSTTVYVSSGTGGSTGGTLGTLTYSPSGTVALTSTSPSASVTLTNSTAAQVNYTLTPSSSWVFALPVSSSPSCTALTGMYCVAAGGTATLWITESGASQGATGSVTLTPLLGTVTTIPVTFGTTTTTGSLVPSPSSVQLAYPATSTIPSFAGVTVTNATGSSIANFYAVATTTTGWLSLLSGSTPGTTTPNQAVGSSIYLLVNSTVAASLATNSYSGTVTLYDAATNAAQGTITVTLSVNGASTGTTSSLVAPTSLSFYCPAASCAQPSPLSQTALVSDTGASATATYTGFPSNCILSAGAGSGQLIVAVSCSGATTAGNYSGTVTVTSSLGAQQAVTVSLYVASAAFLAPSPGSITCASSAGCVQNFSLSASNGTTVMPITAVTPSASWITVTPAGCGTSTPTNCNVTINPAGLGNGLTSGTLTITSTNNSVNSSVIVPVTVLVSGSTSTTGPLTLSPTSLTFTTGTPQTLSVTAASSTTFTAAVQTSSCGSNWLSITPLSTLYATPQNFTVTVTPASVTAGSTQCTGAVNLTVGTNTQTVPVTLTIPATVTATPTSLSFAATAGGATTAAQSVSVTSAAGTSGVAFNYSTSASWLLVSAASTAAGTQAGSQGTTPATLYVTVNPASLTATGSPYTGTVTIGSATVSVSVTVSPASSVSATPGTLSFAYTAGNSATSPASGTITVSGTANAQFTATASSTGSWLAVTPVSGTLPASGTATLAVTIQNLSSLTVSSTPYTGTITVSGAGGAAGSTTVSVSLSVTAPLPTILSVTNAASFNSGPVAAGEAITISGTQIGPVTPVALTTAMITNGVVPTTLGGVSVTVGGYPAAMLYVSATQVNAIVPYQINSPVFLVSVPVVVKYLGQTSNGFAETQVAAAPGIFTANASGTGPAVVVNSNLSFNSSANPAKPGDTVALYVTGEGQTIPGGTTGAVIPAAGPFPKSIIAPLVFINGQPALVGYYGETGSSAGVMQINVQIPSNANPGGALVNLPVVVSFGGVTSQTTSTGVGAVTIAVK